MRGGSVVRESIRISGWCSFVVALGYWDIVYSFRNNGVRVLIAGVCFLSA